MYVVSGVDWEGMWAEYLPEKSKLGNSRGLLETKSLTSCDGGWFGKLVFFPVLHLLAINKKTNQC